jgi:hypothetical protein
MIPIVMGTKYTVHRPQFIGLLPTEITQKMVHRLLLFLFLKNITRLLLLLIFSALTVDFYCHSLPLLSL